MRRLLLFTGIAGFAPASLPALAQADLTAMAGMKGACHAEIAGRPASCQPFNLYTEFANGRAMFLFGLDGKVYYSFSGYPPPQRDAKGFTVTSDTLRIATQPPPDRTLPDVSGPCTVQTDTATATFSAIDCDVLSQGIRYRFTLGHITDFERKTGR